MSLPLTKKPARKRKSHTGDLQQIAARIPALLSALESELVATAEAMDVLNRRGLVYATTFWRKHAGEPKYFYLNYTDAQAGRVKIYIGCDADEIDKAKAAVARAKEYDDMQRKFSALQKRIHETRDALLGVARCAGPEPLARYCARQTRD